MDNRICSTPGCDRPVRYPIRGLCNRCYKRAGKGLPPTAVECVIDGCRSLQLKGDYCGQHQTRDPLHSVPRFEASIRQGGAGCWAWTHKISDQGYGWFFAGGRDHMAHRWSYEYHRADIPAGLVLDHLCRNRACVNPWHLEPVTQAVNIQRGLLGNITHCKWGHEYTPENTVIQSAGSRCCRTCRKAQRRQNTGAECKNGHPLNGSNLIVTEKGRRMCRECKRMAARAGNAKRWPVVGDSSLA